MQNQTSAGAALARAVLDSVDNGKQDITNPTLWPNEALYGVEYRLFDRQFPQVDHGTSYVFFKTLGEYQDWVKEKQAWVISTDGDFRLSGKLYVWDWGPQYRDRVSISY